MFWTSGEVFEACVIVFSKVNLEALKGLKPISFEQAHVLKNGNKHVLLLKENIFLMKFQYRGEINVLNFIKRGKSNVYWILKNLFFVTASYIVRCTEKVQHQKFLFNTVSSSIPEQRLNNFRMSPILTQVYEIHQLVEDVQLSIHRVIYL